MGNFQVDEAWSDGRLTSAVILSRSGGDCPVRYPGIARYKVKTKKGRPAYTILSPDLIVLHTQPGTRYQLL